VCADRAPFLCTPTLSLTQLSPQRAVEVEVPFARLLALVSSPFEASLSELSRPKRKQTPEEAAALELFMPSIPKFLCVTRMCVARVCTPAWRAESRL